jgi:hypothetical protein
MTGAIEHYAPASGRVMREDSSTINMAEMVCPLGGGDVTKALTDTTAALLATDTACKMVIVQNDPDSAGNLKVGLTNAPKVKLAPGQFVVLYVTNLNKIYVQAVSTATANAIYQV